MKPREMGKIEKRFFRIVLVIIGILLLVILLGPDANAQQTSLKYHKNLQKEMTFEKVMERLDKAELKSAKAMLKEKKESNKQAKKKQKTNRRRLVILARAREL